MPIAAVPGDPCPCPNGYGAMNGIAESKLHMVTTHALTQQIAIVVLAARPR
jgi:hypothetical protein